LQMLQNISSTYTKSLFKWSFINDNNICKPLVLVTY
jgi:hypothetical protein